MAQRKRSFLITGTGARVGKTTVGCALGFAMRARGLRVGVMKPIDSLESQDVDALALAVGSTIPPELLCPYRGRATSALADTDLAHIAQCFNQIAAQNDVVLVESAGTIETPITPDEDFADLAAMLSLEVIVVAGNRPGCAAAVTLTQQRCERIELKVAGYILCDCDSATSSATDDIETSLKRIATVPYLGRMRHREPLARAIVEQLI
jgi:dethiobiotin synthetase